MGKAFIQWRRRTSHRDWVGPVAIMSDIVGKVMCPSAKVDQQEAVAAAVLEVQVGEEKQKAASEAYLGFLVSQKIEGMNPYVSGGR